MPAQSPSHYGDCTVARFRRSCSRLFRRGFMPGTTRKHTSGAGLPRPDYRSLLMKHSRATSKRLSTQDTLPHYGL